MPDFDWVNDLKELLGNAADYVPGVSSLDELSRGDWGGAATAPLASLGALASLGQAEVKSSIGSQVASGNAAWAFLTGNEQEQIRQQQMMNPIVGHHMPTTGPRVDPGREKWEQVVPGMPLPIQAGLEVATDPVNWIMPAHSAGMAAGLREAAPAAGRLGQSLLPRLATGVETFNMINNTIPDRIMAGTVGRGTRAVRGAVDRKFPTLLADSPKTRVNKRIQDMRGALDEVLASRGETYRGMVPAVIPERGKSVAPFESYSVPPFFDEAFDRGAPAGLKTRAWEAEQRLRARTQSFPGIPGINEAGMSSPEQSGAMWWTRAKEYLQDPNRPLGIVNPPPGGFQSPRDLHGLSEDDMQEMFQDMATMGVAAVVDWDNANSNIMYRGIARTAEATKAAADAITGKWGPGTTPLLSEVHAGMKNIYGDKLPDARFFTAWGWAGPEDNLTKRLRTLQRRVDKGTLGIEEARNMVLTEMSRGSPQSMEHAAAMGTARMMADSPMTADVHPFQGDYAVTGEGVPQNFTDRFASNRESYAKYMRQLFGNDITDEEMEVLRKMSTEILYDEYMNAAAGISGGRGGAAKLFESGQDPKNYTGRMQEEYTKIGAFPGDDPSHIGNRLEDVKRYVSGTKRGQKPTLKKLNAAEYEEITGRKPPSSWSTSKLFEEVKKEGGTGFSTNPTGGVLPSVQKLLDAFAVNRNVLTGDHPDSKFYRDAVDEVMDIVGPGRYEDAMMLIELMAATSSGTGVRNNADNALRAFAEWKLGSDDTIRNGLGLTEQGVETLLNRQNRWVGVREMLNTKNPKTGKVRPELVPEPGDELFMGAMAENQKKEAGRIMQTYAERKEMQEAGLPQGAYAPTQAGPKTNQFAGSFVIKLWQDSLNYALPDGTVKNRILKALDDAATIYTVDRHDTRLTHGATSVTPLDATVKREYMLIANKELPDVRPEDMQSALWYYSKTNQGFLAIGRDDDMATMLRKAWNQKKDPAKMAEIREKIRTKIPDINEFDLQAVADDLMRQEAVMAIVKDSLNDIAKSKDTGPYSGLVRSILGGRNPVSGLFELGNDTLGIISRTGQGLVPRRKVSTAIPEIVTDAEAQLRQIREGKSYGSTWQWDGDSWVPSSDTSGYAVALDSAGTPLSTARRKTSARDIEAFLGKHADLLDEEGMADRIKLGTRIFDDDPARASFDLGIIVPDEATAVRIAQRANQRAIYDIANGRSIETGGTGEPNLSPDDVRGVIESVFGPAVRSNTDPRDVMRRGATIHEMDSVNPISILMRRVVKPFMEQYVEESNRLLPKPNRFRGQQTPGGAVMEDATFGTDPVDFSAIGQEPLVSTQANTILGQTDAAGRTYKDKMLAHYDEAAADLEYVESTGVKWGPELSLDERLAKAGDDTRLKEIIRKYDKEGIDIGYSDPRSVTMGRLRKEIGKEEGVDTEAYSRWDLLRAAWGEQVLFTPKYLLGNIQGAWIQNAFGGTFRAGTPTEFLAAFKLERGGYNEIEKKDILRNLVSFKVAEKWGFDDLPAYIQKGGIRSQTSARGRASSSAMGELTYRVTGSKRIGRAVGRPFRNNADMSQAVETVMRGSLWADVLDREMTAAMSVLEDSINAMAARQGLDEFEFSILRNINPVPGGPSPKRLKQHLMDLGFSEGYAERAGRNYAEAKNISERVAKSEVDKRQFSYDRTNLDEFVGKFIPFHYWFSRALRYYGEEALRHPIVITSYMRANQGIEDAQDDPGLSARQKGFLRVMGTPLGFSLLVNPDALIGVVRVFGLDSSYTPDGETEAGGVVSWLKDRGLGLYPWIDGTLNLMGVYGDTFEPDMLGIRHKTLIGSAINFIAAESGHAPPGSPYADLMGELRYRVSSVVSDFTPDWLAQPVLPKAGGSQSSATLDTVIESRIIAKNPGLTNGELLDIMTNQEDPRYLDAYQDAATAGLIQQLTNITTPVNVRLREDSRDVRNAKISTVFDAAKAAGVSPQEFNPTMGDADFATRYKNLTGKDWDKKDFDKAMEESALTKATPDAKPFVYEEQLYYNLGTDEEREIFQRYQDIRNGDAPETKALPEASREEVAELWVDAKGYRGAVNNVQQLRDSFEATHVQFAEFKGWQSQMYSLKNHLGGSLSEYRRQAIVQNPNAAEYFRRVIDDMKANVPRDQWGDKYLDDKTTNSEAWQAITGRTMNRQDPAPVPGAPPGDWTMPQMQQGFDQQYQPGHFQDIGNVARMYGYSRY